MCTTVIVGKKVTINNKTIIARNEDSHLAINPKRLEIVKGNKIKNRKHKSVYTGVEVLLPEKSYTFTAMPDVISDTYNNGRFSEASVNEFHVAVSSTESLYGNERVLAYDPLIENGIAEDAINDIVAPFIKSAKEGVELLGKYIEKYGSNEGNGIIFSDDKEVWYMEIPTGHHWVAVRIPEDSYAIAPNCVCIEEIDFNSPDYLYSTGIREFVEKYSLNPDREGFNFRKIFGTSTELDRVYNTARAWFGHKYLDKNFDKDPVSSEIPFINKADRLITIEDVEYILSSHYNETIYDPMGNSGTEYEKTRFRAISLSRTQESHIIEIDKLPVKWVAMATTAFTPYVPFFTDVDDIPEEYRDTTFKMDMKYAYWLFKVFSYYVETHYKLFSKENTKYLEEMRSYGRRRVFEIRENASKLSGTKLRAYLTNENEKTVKYMLEKTRNLLNEFMTRALSVSKMSFTMDKNL
ncbi:C69 family dipeptidase [Caviibacter abscessus]|uniref:C69 family dipeptidase n=1 Tax=Caviibacter abscessus TaxID=1766719 RepID=UPI0008341B96|nr:C69 family dipeptidase [Caviibacter abscessus]